MHSRHREVLFCCFWGFFIVNRICQSKERLLEEAAQHQHSTSNKWGFSKIEVPTCVDETTCERWWINIICLRRLNFSLSSHVSYLPFYRCVDFTCLMDKKIETLKTSFSLFMFKKPLLSSVRFRDLKQLMLFEWKRSGCKSSNLKSKISLVLLQKKPQICFKFRHKSLRDKGFENYRFPWNIRVPNTFS